MPREQGASPEGDGPAFLYDFNTLFDMIDGRFEGEVADWHIALRVEGDQFRLVASKGEGKPTDTVPVEGLDWDSAAAALAPKLQRRGLLP